jgi:hypothetical protein
VIPSRRERASRGEIVLKIRMAGRSRVDIGWEFDGRQELDSGQELDNS